MSLTVGTIMSKLGPDSIGVESIPIVAKMTFGDEPIRSLYVEGAGTVTFKDCKGATDTWDVTDFTTIPIAMTEITSFTATGLHGIR